ncbi:Uncharacterized protein FKW44_008871 [Caligus rogercresseyi]|uniref:Uncharacterized protein n=1 Tax=Caligus rogercresseyi TaxID=217165 RepID=A0A7T8HEH0_CALRO|nr:Uncharacterized protein FKW44_008871 [Caligus rogercresseyi]
MVCLPQTQEFKIKNGAFIQILFTIPFGKHERQVNQAAGPLPFIKIAAQINKTVN